MSTHGISPSGEPSTQADLLSLSQEVAAQDPPESHKSCVHTQDLATVVRKFFVQHLFSGLRMQRLLSYQVVSVRVSFLEWLLQTIACTGTQRLRA